MNGILALCPDMIAGAVVVLPAMLICHYAIFHNWKKTAAYALFALYLTAMAVLVGLPNIYHMGFSLTLNRIPFRGIKVDLIHCVLNVLLFIPLGIFLPCLWKKFRSFPASVLEGFCISLFIETMQIFTFRLTDVDDLINNTLGTALGFLIAKLLLKKMPALSANSRERFLIYGITLAAMMLVRPLIVNLF